MDRRDDSIALLLAAGFERLRPKALCSSEVIQTTRDADSDRYAVTEARSCGATTGVATVVRVGRASQAQDAAQDVFVADDGGSRSGPRGTIWTNMVWTDPGHLLIARASLARVFKQLAASHGATISYRATDPFTLPPVP